MCNKCICKGELTNNYILKISLSYIVCSKFYTMDNLTEIAFLRAIESKKDIIVSKHNTKEMREEKKKVLEDIKSILFTVTDWRFTEAQLMKRWSNIQTRCPAKCLPDADQLCVRILGEDNPKLSQIPEGIHNTTETLGNLAEETDEVSPSCSNKRKVKDTTEDTKEQYLDDLHREILVLQKEKLKLSIKKLKLQVQCEKAEKSTQTQHFEEEFTPSPEYYNFP